MARVRVTAGLVLVALLAGCYASTEPATEVGSERAKLNARGTADDGPARSWFEYEVTGRVGDPQESGSDTWPAGASGPFSRTVTGLAAETPYSFRVCGQDLNGDPPACAQWRTFTTAVATEDAVRGGWFAGCCTSFSVDARSGPSGENARGSMRWDLGSSFSQESTSFIGVVTCLAVDGRQAVVGAVGHRTREPAGTTDSASLLVLIEDGVTAADRYAEDQLQGGATPPDCEGAEIESGFSLQEWFEFVVNDAPAGAG